MAQFFARIKGARGEATRLGNKVSGLTATVNGWDAGVRVEARHVNGRDEFDIYETTGSHANGHDELITQVRGPHKDT